MKPWFPLVSTTLKQGMRMIPVWSPFSLSAQLQDMSESLRKSIPAARAGSPGRCSWVLQMAKTRHDKVIPMTSMTKSVHVCYHHGMSQKVCSGVLHSSSSSQPQLFLLVSAKLKVSRHLNAQLSETSLPRVSKGETMARLRGVDLSELYWWIDHRLLDGWLSDEAWHEGCWLIVLVKSGKHSVTDYAADDVLLSGIPCRDDRSRSQHLSLRPELDNFKVGHVQLGIWIMNMT